jgi:hypothetical protein
MIRLTLIGAEGRAAPAMTGAYFRITGGAVWTRPGDEPLVRYCQPSWRYADAQWLGMRFEGRCRIVFGLPRDPAGVSGLLDAVSIYGCTLSANGVPFAVFEPDRDMWRGAAKDSWWHAFRLESAGLRPPTQRSLQGEELIPPTGPPQDQGDQKSINQRLITLPNVFSQRPSSVRKSLGQNIRFALTTLIR